MGSQISAWAGAQERDSSNIKSYSPELYFPKDLNETFGHGLCFS